MTRMHQVEWRFWLQQRRKIDPPLVWRSELAELKETASAKLTAFQICLFEQVCLPVEEWMSLEEFLRREFGEPGYGRSYGWCKLSGELQRWSLEIKPEPAGN